MNKRGLIKLMFVFLAFFISFYFMNFETKILGIQSISLLFVLSIIPLTIFMYQELKYIKNLKIKFVYDVVLLLFTIGSICEIIFFVYNILSCIFSTTCSHDIAAISSIIYVPTIVSALLISITSVYRKTNKLNDYLTIIVSIIIIFIHLRYYFDNNLLNNIYPNSNNTEYYVFVTQNYIYFNIMYVTAIIHKFIN